MSTEADPIVASDDAAPQQNDAPEQKTADLAQPQTDANEAEDQSQEAEGEKLTDEQKTIRKLQRRIDRLTAGRGAAQREAELLRERVGQLQQPQEQDEERKADPQDIDRLATEKAKVLHQQQTVATRAAAVMASGKKLQGFDEAVNAVADEVPFTDRKGAPTPFIEAVLDTDKPAELLHYLGNNPEEAAAFAGLSPAQIGRRLAKLESSLVGKAKASNAPAPIQTIGGNRGKTSELGALSMDDYVAARKKQGAVWAR